MLPTAFPRARSGKPLNAARTETAASGVVVPSETIVAPMMTLGTPSRSEMPTAPVTSQSAPLMTSTMLATMAAASAPVERFMNISGGSSFSMGTQSSFV
ncbi:MAG: hypothetical protein BWZ10_02359 [candidate division BRC1 bacterium ADurb.BinA364]|nr:MAG: hypothetical protein BWZ10_02359 [candidate division BRC1 bacterium ADurb.BinA364]